MRARYPFRKELLAEPRGLKGVATHVEWLSARDSACCEECSRRNGQKYTLEEARRILLEDYCQPLDSEQGCRCTFVVVTFA
jgi:hypothetical protein